MKIYFFLVLHVSSSTVLPVLSPMGLSAVTFSVLSQSNKMYLNELSRQANEVELRFEDRNYEDYYRDGSAFYA